MGATNKTTYLELPQFEADDKPTWLGDVNDAMLKIDEGYNNINGAASTALATAQNTANNLIAVSNVANEAKREVENVVNIVYPVGSIYLSVNSTNPGSIFGGSWEQIKDKFLLAAGDSYAAGTEGGSATNTLSVQNLPAHYHSLNNHSHSIPALTGTTNETGTHVHAQSAKDATGIAPGGTYTALITDGATALNTGSAGAHSHTVTTTATVTGQNNNNTGSTGSATPVNNIPPYTCVYVWKRTA